MTNKKKKLKKLNEMWRNGLSVCSIMFAKELLKDFPNEFKILIILGSALTEVDRHNEAIKSIEKAIHIGTPNQEYQAFVTMAFIHYNMGAFSVAVTWYNKALTIKPLRPIDIVFMGDCLIKVGKYSEAVIFLKQSIGAQSSSDVDIYFHLGLAYRAEEKYDIALEYFQRAIDTSDNYVAAKEAIDDIVSSRGQILS